MRDYESTLKQARTCANQEYCDIGGNCEYYDAGVCCQGGETDILNEAADAIEELLAAVPKWIPVTERLPDEDMEVLISYRYKEGEGDTNHVNIDITTYGQMYFGGREVEGVKHWRPPFEYFSSNYEVVAWMPRPEPPKEVE